MTRPEVTEQAQKFNGREYPLRLTTAEKQSLKDAGLVVIHPHSDDCAEIEGAITDEASVYEGGKFLLTQKGVIDPCFHGLEQYTSRHSRIFIERLEGEDFLVALKKFCGAARSAIKIEAVWGQDGYSWQYRLDMPHAVFNLMEDGEIMAKCVVFHVDDMGGGRNE
jgi:hypothetical protein